MEFESFNSGTLLHIGLGEGDSAKVDALLAIIGPSGTDVSSIAKNFKIKGGNSEEKSEPKAEVKPSKVESKSLKTETKKEEVKVTASNSTGRIFASPLAKKMAEEKGINLSQVNGSGENGRVVKRDVENYRPSAANTSSLPVAKFVATGHSLHRIII